jgi:hypothetical protein
MESLALLVSFILATAYFAGPLAFIATRIPGKNSIWVFGRRLLIAVLSLAGIEFSLQLMFAKIPLFPKLFAIVGLCFAIAALVKEWQSFKRKNI